MRANSTNIGNGQIYTWRRQAMSGELTGNRRQVEPGFAEVQISDMMALPAAACSSVSGLIGIDILSDIKLTVDNQVDLSRSGCR